MSAKNSASHDDDQLRGMQRTMDEINDATANISKIIKVIDEIAF